MNRHSGQLRLVPLQIAKAATKDRLISPGLPVPTLSKRVLTTSLSISTNSDQPGLRETFHLAEALPKALIPRFQVRMQDGDLHPFFWGFPVVDRLQKTLRLPLRKRTLMVTSRTITR